MHLRATFAMPLGLALTLATAPPAPAQEAWPDEQPLEQTTPLFDVRLAAAFEAMDVSGDSISRAFNGAGRWPCANADQEWFNWATSDTHGASLCSAGPEGVYSHAERTECARGAHISAATPNHAASGAQLLKHFASQAVAIKTWLLTQPSPRYVPVLLGHNDVCGGTVDKFQLFGCGRGSDQNRFNHCRTAPEAFERELRRGLDTLITVPDTHIGVAAMVRVSQLCNHGGKTNCQVFTSCQNLWTTVAYLGWIFGQANGICGSLTLNCSPSRIRDAYATAKTYRDVTARVTAEYALVPMGGQSPVVFVGGQWVGGATKAMGVTLQYSDAPWRYRFSSSHLNCCDCFHPSPAGQNVASRVLFQGFSCTASEPCCLDTADGYRSGLCLDVLSDGTFVPGVLN